MCSSSSPFDRVAAMANLGGAGRISTKSSTGLLPTPKSRLFSPGGRRSSCLWTQSASGRGPSSSPLHRWGTGPMRKGVCVLPLTVPEHSRVQMGCWGHRASGRQRIHTRREGDEEGGDSGSASAVTARRRRRRERSGVVGFIAIVYGIAIFSPTPVAATRASPFSTEIGHLCH